LSPTAIEKFKQFGTWKAFMRNNLKKKWEDEFGTEGMDNIELED